LGCAPGVKRHTRLWSL